MTDLAEFLKARLAEDERAARKAAKFKYDRPTDAPWEKARLALGNSFELSSSAHIARHDPARVLREVEAKRRIVDAYEAQLAERAKIGELRDAEMAKGDELAPAVAELTGKGIAINGWIRHLEWVVRVHAAASADHPDYREDWRP